MITTKRGEKAMHHGTAMGYLLAAGLLISSALWTQGGEATCIQTCQFYLLDEDCRTPTLSGTWPSDVPLSFGVRCGGCCSAPGGPGNCVWESVPDPSGMSIAAYDPAATEGSPPIEGTFKKTGKTCQDIPLFEFDGKLDPGSYVLTAGEGLMLSIVDTAGNPDAVAYKPLEYYLAPPPEQEDPADAGTGGPPDAGAAAPAAMPPQKHDGGCASCAVEDSGEGNGTATLLAALLALFLACARRRDRP
jgi:MYXO-CTERM domain-containing protein